MKATFGAGCFWGVEVFFKELTGVQDAVCGYMGGELDNPSYPEVKQGNTGHAEVVEVTFDESQISYEQLVLAFWKNHDPTTLNKQGIDEGTQYRSAIFFHNEEQQRIAEASKAYQQANNPRFASKTIVTEITAASTFYEAEDYHQSYFEKNNLPSCHIAFE
ncbi:peptide-methionine (S)-S-oxide reductase MsrA [Paraferrimonas sp. SM1919]|uniref:peptide-methionine (S)-S-oxide reductase MsrA n=1 Tax=Paraferrimonas sp. SM1919 TaxID=2662263 RepID=UPI0013D68F37|nr:peptide-methionine (S)-S-oxide reductase MsrA [Paraferrimonas sp. SM1919]